MSTISGATLSTISSILKDDWMGPIRETLNHSVLLLHRITQTSEYTSGSRAYIPLHTKRNRGVGSRAEASSDAVTNLPQAGKQGYKSAVYGMQYHYASVEFTGPAIAAARDANGSFARLVETEVNGAITDAQRDMNRQCFGSISGSIATILAVPGATHPDGAVLAANEYHVSDIRHFQIDDAIDIVDNSPLGTLINTQEILVTAFNENRSTIFLSSSGIGTPTASNFIVRRRNYMNEMFGLEDLVNDGNPALALASADSIERFVGGIDRTTAGNEFWKSREFDHNNARFGDSLFRQATDYTERYTQGKTSIHITTYEIYNEYGYSLLPDRRFNTSGSRFTMLDGGFEALDYNGVPVVKERDCPTGLIYSLDESSIMMLLMSDWDWMDKDGSMLARVPGKDAYGATLFTYRNLATDDARRNVLTKNVKV